MKFRSEFANEEAHKKLRQYGKFFRDGEDDKKRSRSVALFDFFQSHELFNALPKITQEPWKNADSWKNRLKDRKDFCGGTPEELRSKKDLRKYEKRIKELSKSKLAQRLEAKLGTTNRRKRMHDEYDGEFDFDRAWDLKPFSLARKAPCLTRALEITADMNFNAYVKAPEIERYGVTCAAICGILESKGFSVSIKLRMTGEAYHYGDGNKAYEIISEIKRPGEYVTPQRIVQAFSPNYMRRVMFSYISLIAELNGHKVSENLGRPIKGDKAITQSKGKLGIHNIKALDEENLDAVLEAILKAVA